MLKKKERMCENGQKAKVGVSEEMGNTEKRKRKMNGKEGRRVAQKKTRQEGEGKMT